MTSELSTSEILQRLGYTTRDAGYGKKHIVLCGTVVFTGNVFEVNEWLRETGQKR